MKPPSTALLCALLCACGPQAAQGPGLDFTLLVSAGLNDQLSAFQVSLVTQGASLDCVAVENSCLVSQVDRARFVPLSDARGVAHPALVDSLALVAGTPSTQDLTLTGLPVGKDYALVIEALSKDSPPRLAGSSCNYVRELTSGTNATVLAKILPHSPPLSCDPRVER
jgi:hypothetical protein